MVYFLTTINDALEFNAWMDTLDKRYQAKQKTEGAVFPKKTRREGALSESCPPEGAPGWAINRDWIDDSGNGKILG